MGLGDDFVGLDVIAELLVGAFVVKEFVADLIRQRQIAADDINWDSPKSRKMRL